MSTAFPPTMANKSATYAPIAKASSATLAKKKPLNTLQAPMAVGIVSLA